MLVVGVALVFLVVLGMRVLPSALEYNAVKRAVVKTAASGSTTILEFQRTFDKIASVDDISSITGRDLTIARVDGTVTIEFSYEKRIPLFGPASLLLDYNGTATGRAN